MYIKQLYCCSLSYLSVDKLTLNFYIENVIYIFKKIIENTVYNKEFSQQS